VGGGVGSAPVADGCPRCAKRVYEAEKKVAVGKVSISLAVSIHPSIYLIQAHKQTTQHMYKDRQQ